MMQCIKCRRYMHIDYISSNAYSVSYVCLNCNRYELNVSLDTLENAYNLIVTERNELYEEM